MLKNYKSFQNRCFVSLAIGWLFVSACRLGNRVESSSTNISSQDDISGIYELFPKTVTYCIQTSTAQNGKCLGVTTDQISASLAAILTNPVRVSLSNLQTGEGTLSNPKNPNQSLPTRVQIQTAKLTYSGKSNQESLWGNYACGSQMLVDQIGFLDRFPSEHLVNSFKTVGKLVLRITIETLFDGTECPSAFAEILDCYQNAERCGQESSELNLQQQEIVRQYFVHYIDTGLLSLEEIPSLVSMGYEITYP